MNSLKKVLRDIRAREMQGKIKIWQAGDKKMEILNHFSTFLSNRWVK